MKFRQIVTSRSFLTLLTINVAIIIYYTMHPGAFKTLVWIYWCQSVLIGFFTFLRLLFLKKIIPGSLTINDQPVTAGKQEKGCMALFFAVHYGFFHLIYSVFIIGIGGPDQKVDFIFLEIAVGAFFLDQLWNFIQMEMWDHTHEVNAGLVFFLPYARIVPMHLTILLPKFFGLLSALGVFLILKTIADLIMHAVSMKVYGQPDDPDPTVLHIK